MISGIESRRPNTNSSGCPREAAAMAMTLSRLITASAMAMVRTAFHSVSELSMLSWPSSLADRELDRDPNSRSPPSTFRKGRPIR